MTKIIDGKKIANQIREEMKQEVHKILNDLKGRAPHCAVILVGDNAASQTYVASKERAFKKAGMMSTVYRLDKETKQEELMEIIHIGEARVKDLIELRPHNTVNGLKRIKGIGDARMKDIIEQDKACVR